VKLSKIAKHDTDSLEIGRCSFHDSRGHTTLHCWALKKHLEEVVQCGYLDEFILDSEEDPKVREAPAETVN